MSTQRKLNALLFELQTAQSPLAQAKILARSWRTVRDLSPTDRRLLARHVGFEGAEQVLEGLASKNRGFAPGALLQMLDNARSTDASTVSDLISAIRDPSRRVEAVTMGADFAADLLGDPNQDLEPSEEISNALGELQSVDPDPGAPAAGEALAAHSALAGDSFDDGHSERGESSGDGAPRDPESPAEDRLAIPGPPPPPPAKPTVRSRTPKPPPGPPRPPVSVAPLEGWSHLATAAERNHPGPALQPATDEPGASGPPGIDVTAALRDLGAEPSPFSRLLALRREVETFCGSGAETLRGLLDEFPVGWARRRALSALVAVGIPEDAAVAVELIADLEREVDRRWCLGVLARRGDLRGAALQRSLDLLSSPRARAALKRTAAAG